MNVKRFKRYFLKNHKLFVKSPFIHIHTFLYHEHALYFVILCIVIFFPFILPFVPCYGTFLI